MSSKIKGGGGKSVILKCESPNIPREMTKKRKKKKTLSGCFQQERNTLK